jgi:signal peptidase I
MTPRFAGLWRDWRGTLVFLTLMFVFRGAVADYMRVPSGSMNPTIIEGDRLLVRKIDLGLRLPLTSIWLTQGETPKRGQIAVFFSPANGTTLVKRVIGLPGDTVAMVDDRLIINGETAEYAPLDPGRPLSLPAVMEQQPHLLLRETLGTLDHPVLLLPTRGARRDFGPVTVPADEYLMLGDSRDNSADSRYIGTVPRRLIIGIASDVLFSLDYDDHYLPRSDRFVTALH